MKPRIQLVIARTDGRGSSATNDGDAITAAMTDAAKDLLETLTTGERPPIKGLYDLCARAFSTSRDDAKERIVAASYGMSEAKIENRTSSRDQVLAHTIAARRERAEARAAVDAWMKETPQQGNAFRHDEMAPGWDRLVRAETAYGYALRAFEAWLDEHGGQA